MNSATAHDYAWIRSSPVFRLMTEVGYTLTLIRRRPPHEVLRAMETEPRGTGEGTAGLIEAHHTARDETGDDYWDESYVAGAFTVRGEGGDWTLVLGFDSGLGITKPCMKTLSEDGRVVAHSTNGGKPMHFFDWYEDGVPRTTFESAARRDGSTPDELVPLLRDAGFPVTPEGDYDDEAAPDADPKAAAFALAERLTGVRVTESLLRDATYALGLVPERAADG
ncbi:DUF6461 domain-containing protein [Streptomyces sp. S6]